MVTFFDYESSFFMPAEEVQSLTVSDGFFLRRVRRFLRRLSPSISSSQLAPPSSMPVAPSDNYEEPIISALNSTTTAQSDKFQRISQLEAHEEFNASNPIFLAPSSSPKYASSVTSFSTQSKSPSVNIVLPHGLAKYSSQTQYTSAIACPSPHTNGPTQHETDPSDSTERHPRFKTLFKNIIRLLTSPHMILRSLRNNHTYINSLWGNQHLQILLLTIA